MTFSIRPLLALGLAALAAAPLQAQPGAAAPRVDATATLALAKKPAPASRSTPEAAADGVNGSRSIASSGRCEHVNVVAMCAGRAR